MSAAAQHTVLLPPPAVEARTSLSRTTIWRRVKDGSFPKPIRISANRIAWPEAAVESWIASRSEAA